MPTFAATKRKSHTHIHIQSRCRFDILNAIFHFIVRLRDSLIVCDFLVFFQFSFCEKMPNPSKGKCVLNATLKEKYPFLETAKSNSDIFCRKCKGNFSIASGGNADIMRHLKTKKHIEALAAASSSQPIVNFFTPTFDSVTTAIEATWAFHTINGNHSFQIGGLCHEDFSYCI